MDNINKETIISVSTWNFIPISSQINNDNNKIHIHKTNQATNINNNNISNKINNDNSTKNNNKKSIWQVERTKIVLYGFYPIFLFVRLMENDRRLDLYELDLLSLQLSALIRSPTLIWSPLFGLYFWLHAQIVTVLLAYECLTGDAVVSDKTTNCIYWKQLEDRLANLVYPNMSDRSSPAVTLWDK